MKCQNGKYQLNRSKIQYTNATNEIISKATGPFVKIAKPPNSPASKSLYSDFEDLL
ncbi:hypothetical protein JCM31826_04790 [Thermaurantimonas aggregans]|uniref:Uncharacterized protein n=1 Tax=Thermaurantimonas aggregans TaxID=2173829 RepID=A0A401XIY4_9FLAO|nr:hypothetical protein JCM31826_04790 [Thermaurantimonas aggregans]